MRLDLFFETRKQCRFEVNRDKACAMYSLWFRESVLIVESLFAWSLIAPAIGIKAV